MSKRRNEKFVDAFIALDRACCDKFGIGAGGVTEYIKRLDHAHRADKREIVLPTLVRYRNLRNRFAYEPNLVKKSNDVNGKDIKWMKKFTKSILKNKDTLAVYVKKTAKSYNKKTLRKIFSAGWNAEV